MLWHPFVTCCLQFLPLSISPRISVSPPVTLFAWTDQCNLYTRENSSMFITRSLISLVPDLVSFPDHMVWAQDPPKK